ncbi:hypothetical protein VB715_20700 [Crocosphaera sp. UHCC 0190]|uniref:hypothetical protein n=1 Tax=Crocosphaera sp. UHCC 0190 TaxID=3110246 RepID=UPI002B1EBAD9|nr:hypothetical protein [Crocosphaera sp. UHCC 0190]MEA5512197.1 hypothetical protein [Crocosphaera sp. UHCC 0190]
MRPENWPKHLRTTSERLQSVQFLSLDFEEVIESIEEDFFLFIDPPYFGADQDKFYSCSFNLDDHYRLNNVLKKNASKFRFLITYDNVPEIREMYQWCTSIQDNQWNYTISQTDDQKNNRKLADGYKSNRYQGKEIFITNYDINKVSRVEPLEFTKFL